MNEAQLQGHIDFVNTMTTAAKGLKEELAAQELVRPRMSPKLKDWTLFSEEEPKVGVYCLAAYPGVDGCWSYEKANAMSNTISIWVGLVSKNRPNACWIELPLNPN